jgi:hypothetical protein
MFFLLTKSMVLFIVVVAAAPDFVVVIITECRFVVNASIYIWQLRCLWKVVIIILCWNQRSTDYLLAWKWHAEIGRNPLVTRRKMFTFAFSWKKTSPLRGFIMPLLTIPLQRHYATIWIISNNIPSINCIWIRKDREILYEWNNI